MSDTILTFDKSSSSSSLNPPSRTVCHVCQKQFSQYTCPRCNSRYCSLKCYQSHSRGCTESFMRENVVDEMRQMQPDDETKRKMLEILKRLHSEEESDSIEEETDSMEEDESTLSEETIQKILSGAQVSFDDLSAKEKKLFQRTMASGTLSKMIEPWDPWWLKPSARTICLSQQGTQLVQPLDKHDASAPVDHDLESSESTEIPPAPDTPLPPVSKLSSTEPSPLLVIHLVDMLFSYCFTLRLYNGDWQSDTLGSAMMALSVSAVLGRGGQPETVKEAVSYCLEQTCTSYKQMGGLQFGLAVIDDVITLLSLGGSALICSLCDIQRMIQAGERELKSENTKKSGRVEIRRKLKLAERKIYFMMCWVHEQPGETWSSAAAILKEEKLSCIDHGGVKSSAKLGDKTESRSKVLIEEME
ncbi:zinc finger HIT domain-containing protein 2 [Mangifera indica]|uniref:zinc finger HIT domain-containing protein 2 n=1 Tax=Mangifera indica TaxID=29780 RepID=UPI001CFA7F0D|nr:zinc finger HIT domain-containing protein 2 [Mangifera indica]